MRHSGRFAGRGLALLLLAASALTAPAFMPTPVQAQDLRVSLGGGNVTRATVRPGTTVTVRTNRAFADLVVGDAGTADVVPLTERSLYIQGKNPGFTNVSIFDENKNLLGIIDVRVQQSADDVASAVQAAVPGADINVSTANNTVRLSGVVANAADQARAIEAAQQFSDKKVISALSVAGAQQVSLEVRVLEASRTAGRDLGVKVRGRGGTSLFGSGSGLVINADDNAQPATFLSDANSGERLASGDTPFGTLVAQVLEGAGVRIDVIIDALERKGLARRLAQPNLTSVSGEPARFHAGGEVPIQSSTMSGGTTSTNIDYRPYGVVLEFVPTVLEDSKINIRVHSEVSEIDRTVNVNGNPGFISRKAATVIELRDGQSFAMAGLLQVINDRDIEALPWLGQVPILGALFRSTSYRKKETDLVIVVTPRLVRPAEPGEKLYSPLDQTRPSNDVELFALGILEVDKDMLRKFREGEGIAGPYGHRIDLEFEDDVVAKK